jgi:hypothetical protein
MAKKSAADGVKNARCGFLGTRFYRSTHETKRGAFMRMNFKPYVWVLAVVVGTGIIGSTVRAVASPAMNASGQDQDYSKNKRYQQGVREGKDDKAHNRDHFRKRHFKRDEDNRAYEAGYQQGHVIDVHIN